MQNASSPCVQVVDDDPAVLACVARLLRSAGFDVRTFSSSAAFLGQAPLDEPGCVVLDLSMPGPNGLDAQAALARAGGRLPVIFLSGNADVPSTVLAMKAGAVDFLTKPFEADALLAAVHAALEKDRLARVERAERRAVTLRVTSLTPREREVLVLLVQGKPNKQIAAELGAAERTIKVHRARVLCKMQVRSVAELVRMTERARVTTPAS